VIFIIINDSRLSNLIDHIHLSVIPSIILALDFPAFWR